MSRHPRLSLVLLCGCTAGPVDLTLIDDVRVIAAIAEPPEAGFDELVSVTAIIANPTDRPADVLLWQCGPPELPCLRTGGALEGDEFTGSFVPAFPIWILACRDALCGTLDQIGEDTLRDPYRWLQELPIEGVAAASKVVSVTEKPPAERHQNPVIEDEPSPLDGVEPEQAQSLSFVVPGGSLASGLATAGGFDRVSTEVASDGTVTVSWYAPSDASFAQLYVVFDDPFGGTALWRGDATVR